jgi:UDP-N-acetylmuramyl tripeptide synthase
MMPAVSIQLADITILTAEDPRTEPHEGILEKWRNRRSKPAAWKA